MTTVIKPDGNIEIKPNGYNLGSPYGHRAADDEYTNATFAALSVRRVSTPGVGVSASATIPKGIVAKFPESKRGERKQWLTAR